MSYNVAKLTGIDIAKDLAEHGDEVYCNDAQTEFYTYEDVAAANLDASVYTNTRLSTLKNEFLNIMTYDAASLSYPIRRSRMFPRKPR